MRLRKKFDVNRHKRFKARFDHFVSYFVNKWGFLILKKKVSSLLGVFLVQLSYDLDS